MICGERTPSNTDSLVAQRAGMFNHRADPTAIICQGRTLRTKSFLR
jgi:hypothetical protein